MSNRKRLSQAVAFAFAGIGLSGFAEGLVSVTAETGPAPTFTVSGGVSTSDPVNFTTQGTAGWVFWPTNSSNGVSNPPYEMSGNATAFSPLLTINANGSTGSAVGSGRATLGSGATAAVTTTNSNTVNVTNQAGYTYVNATSPTTGAGMEANYSIPAMSNQLLDIYCFTQGGTDAKLTLTENDGGTITQLYSDPTSGVALPASTSTSFKTGGVYSFDLANPDATAHTITFAYTIQGFNTAESTTAYVGFEGATVSNQSSLLVLTSPNHYDMGPSSQSVGGISDSGRLGGTIGSSATGQNLTLTVTPALNATDSFSGLITNNLPGGSGNTVSLLFNGAGTQILSGSNTYTGSTTLTSGTLQLGANNTLPSTTQLLFSGSPTLNLNNFSQTVAGMNVAGGSVATLANGTLTLAPGGTILINDALASTTALNGGIISLNGGTIDASATTGVASGFTVSINSQITGTGGLIVKAFGNTSDDGATGVAGAGSNSLYSLTNASNSFTGGVTIATGLVNIAAGDGIFGNGTVASTNTVTIQPGAGVVLGVKSAPTNTTLYSNFVLSGPGAHYFRVYGSDVLTIASPITDGGAGASLYKTDAGALELSASNTYTGLTQANDGLVYVTGDESAATGGWAVGTASQYTTAVTFYSGSTINVSSGSAVSVGTLPGNTSTGTAAQTLTAQSTVNNSGALNIGLSGSLNVASGAVWTQIGPMSLQPSNLSTSTLSSNTSGASLLITGGVFNYISASPINLTPSIGNAVGATVAIAGGTLNTSQGFINSAYDPLSGNANASTGTASVSLTNGGTLTLLNNIPSLAITNGAALTISVGSGAGGIINTNGFNTSIGAVISDAAGGAGVLNKMGAGTLTLSAGNNYSGGTVVGGGTLVFAAPSALPVFSSLTVNAGASAVAAPFTGTKNSLFASNLSLAGTSGAWTGKLDLTNNDLVVRGASLATVTNQVAQGYNGGTWNSTGGIVSSAAAADTTHLTALGVIQNSVDQNGGTALVSTFDGQSVNNTDILVKYTYYGDTDLNGSVDGTDYSRIDNAYLNNLNTGSPQLTGWYNGDFNYDGVIDGSDYTLIDNAFNTQGTQIASAIATPTAQIAGTGSAVPEPSCIGVIALSALGVLGRRRGK